MQRLELVGKRFGRLTVTEFKGIRNGHGYWQCRCDCGNSIISKGTLLKKGAIKSCGCYRKDIGKEKNRTHGLSGTRPYYVWKDIIRRCYDETRPEYKNYGGRGIKMCDEWLKSVENFCKWAEESGYEKGLTIERRGNDGNYEPTNCEWVSMKAQLNNNRRNHLIEINGVLKTIAQWSDDTGIKYDTLWARVSKGYTGSSLLMPIEEKYRHKKSSK
jgi:hypothetical protein